MFYPGREGGQVENFAKDLIVFGRFPREVRDQERVWGFDDNFTRISLFWDVATQGACANIGINFVRGEGGSGWIFFHGYPCFGVFPTDGDVSGEGVVLG